MLQLNLPTYHFRIQETNEGRKDIYDPVRRIFVALTPEEWVRQNLIRFLESDRGFPVSLMSVEKAFHIHQKEYRADIVLHNTNGQAIMIVECKAPEVKLTQEVFQQAARYNLHYQVAYLMISNGLQHYCALIDFEKNTTRILPDVPHYQDMSICR